MAEVHFELTGNAKVQIAIQEAQGGTLLCHLGLPSDFAAVSELSLTLSYRDAVIRQVIPVPTRPLDAASDEPQTTSAFLSNAVGELQLSDLYDGYVSLDAIDANDAVFELSAVIPIPDEHHANSKSHEALLADMAEEDDIIIRAAPDSSHGATDHAPPQPAPIQIATQASEGIAQHYVDEIEDSFIMIDYGDLS